MACQWRKGKDGGKGVKVPVAVLLAWWEDNDYEGY